MLQLSMVVAKNFMRTHQFIFLVCNLSKEKISPFSFSLTHTLTLFLSISSHGLHLSKCLNISLCFALSGTHTQYGQIALLLQLSVFASAHNKAEWPLLSSFFCSISFSVSHTPKSLPKEMAADFGTLLIKKSDLSMLCSLLIK